MSLLWFTWKQCLMFPISQSHLCKKLQELVVNGISNNSEEYTFDFKHPQKCFKNLKIFFIYIPLVKKQFYFNWVTLSQSSQKFVIFKVYNHFFRPDIIQSPWKQFSYLKMKLGEQLLLAKLFHLRCFEIPQLSSCSSPHSPHFSMSTFKIIPPKSVGHYWLQNVDGTKVCLNK